MVSEPVAVVPAPKARLMLPAALLVVYTAIVVWTFVAESRSWPHVGSWRSFLFIPFCPGIVFQTVNLIFRWRTGRPLKRWVLVRLATIPAGLILAGVLVGSSSDRSWIGFTRAYEPFVAEIGAHLADPCPAALRAFTIPSLAAYNRRAGYESPLARLSYDKAHFVLWFSGGSIDIDGSRLFFDSTAKKWDMFHNDNRERAATFDGLVARLTECRVSAQPQ